MCLGVPGRFVEIDEECARVTTATMADHGVFEVPS